MSDPATAPTPFHLRVWRCAVLQADTYEEVEADRSSIGQAFVVVTAACLAAAVGGWLRSAQGASLPDDVLPRHWVVIVIALEPLVIWLLGAAFSFMVGASFFRGAETETDYSEVLRTTGFAFGPGVLAVLAAVPVDAFAIGVIVVYRIWVPVAWIVAVRQALDFTTARAIGTFGFAALLMWLVLWGLSVAPI